MQLQAAGLSDVGKVRAQNQDSIFVSAEPIGPLPNLFIVADGMGGHNAGDVASRQAVALFTDYIRNHRAEPADFLDLCVSAAGYANHGIYTQALNDPALNGMGTTFSACIITDGYCQITHVGDSRVYLFSEETLTPLTQDHSYVNELLKAGQITAEQAIHHSNRNILTRVMGVDHSMEVDGYPRTLDGVCAVLLCSDGLHGMLADSEIMSIIKESGPVEAKVKALIDSANHAGGKDNISAILVELT